MECMGWVNLIGGVEGDDGLGGGRVNLGWKTGGWGSGGLGVDWNKESNAIKAQTARVFGFWGGWSVLSFFGGNLEWVQLDPDYCGLKALVCLID